MSKKWLVISTLGILLLGAVPCIWFAMLPDDFHVAKKLQARGFVVCSYAFWQSPERVIARDRIITPEDCRLICRLSSLETLQFVQCDMSGLNLDEIGNCRELSQVVFAGVTKIPANELRKLALKQAKTEKNFGKIFENFGAS